MKRYRVVVFEFDFTANSFRDEHSEPGESPEAQETFRQIEEEAIEIVRHRFGAFNIDAKVQNLKAIEAQALSVVSFYNSLYRQVRNAFVAGDYFPATTGSLVLGEHILNELYLRLRDEYPLPEKYKSISNHQSSQNWKALITTLAEWNVLLPDVEAAFRRLEKVRRTVIHLQESNPPDFYQLGSEGIRDLNLIIGGLFGFLRSQPWMIEGEFGIPFVKKSFEDNPFVRQFILPNCALVGPAHRLEGLDQDSMRWLVHDVEYPEIEISDSEYMALYQQARQDYFSQLERESESQSA